MLFNIIVIIISGCLFIVSIAVAKDIFKRGPTGIKWERIKHNYPKCNCPRLCDEAMRCVMLCNEKK